MVESFLMGAEAQQVQAIGRGDTVLYWDYVCTVIGAVPGPDGEQLFRVGTINTIVTAIFEGVKSTEMKLIAKKKPKLRAESVPIH